MRFTSCPKMHSKNTEYKLSLTNWIFKKWKLTKNYFRENDIIVLVGKFLMNDI